MTAFAVITKNTAGAQSSRCGWTISERTGTVTTFSLDSALVTRLS